MATPQQRLWCMASVCSCLELVANAYLALEEDPAATYASLKAVLKAVEAVTLGSDLHVITAAQTAVAAGLVHGDGSAEHAAAVAYCRGAQRLRYGPVTGPLADTFATLNRTLY
jgi:hypothetical protein